MATMRRILWFALATIAVLPSQALARGGGGSSGFHSSGGGGGFHSSGGGFHSGGGGFDTGGGTSTGGAIIAVVIIGVVLLIVTLAILVPVIRARRAARPARAPRGMREREERVEAAASEAAEEHPELAPERVRQRAKALFYEVQKAWNARDRAHLERIVGPELFVEWKRRLDDFDAKGWHNVVHPEGEPQIHYVGLANRGDGDERVVVRVVAKLSDYVDTRTGRMYSAGARSEHTTMDEYWTLARDGDRWRLVSIEQPGEGRHELDEAIVSEPWSDDERLEEQALVEQAVADKAPDGYHVAELASLDFAGDARAMALDLSVADARFSPAVLEAEAKRAVAAWAEAIDSDRGDLRSVATDEAARELLHPGDATEKTRVVVRGPQVRRVRLLALDPAAEPPSMAIELDVRGARYIEDRDTAAVVSGSKTRPTTFAERWTLTLDGSDEHPWRISSVGAAAAA